MFTSQAVADLAVMLTAVTTVEQADHAIRQALRSTGLLNAPTVDQQDLDRLLVALAAQGGLMETLAMQMAIHGTGEHGAGQPPAQPGRAP